MTPRPAELLVRMERSSHPSRRPAKPSHNGGTLNNSLPFPVTQRDLNIILAPGDITYKLFGRPLSLYWDFAYNFTGNERFSRDYGPLYGHYFYVGNSAIAQFQRTLDARVSRIMRPG